MQKNRYWFILVGLMLGIVGGMVFPQYSAHAKIGADMFIRLIKMIIAPVVFCTLAIGIAHMRDMKQLGRVGIKSLLYFELLTTVALIIGYAAVTWWQPGAGMNLPSATPQTNNTATANSNFFLDLIPKSFLDPFVHVNLLQIIIIALLSGFALSRLEEKGKRITSMLEDLSHFFFKILDFIMYLAPIAVAGAMWFTVGELGAGKLWPLLRLLCTVYFTCFIFIVVVLGLVSYSAGFNLWHFIAYIRQEIFLAFATSSSETVLPHMMEKLEKAGCSKPIVNLVIPTGYSFNLDGTCIYLTMAAIFLAQATNTPLSWEDEINLLLLTMLTSKGAAAVTGGGFVTLSATLESFSKIPSTGLAVILGIDRVLSEARTITNLIGNGVATMVIARWEKQLDQEKMENAFKGGRVQE